MAASSFAWSLGHALALQPHFRHLLASHVVQQGATYLALIASTLATRSAELSAIPTVLYGTINGVIGVVASLPHATYQLLESLQVSCSSAYVELLYLGRR